MPRESMSRWWLIATALLALLLVLLVGVGVVRAQARPHIVSVSGIPPSKKLVAYSKFTVNTSDPAAVTKVEFRWSRVCFPDYDDTTAPFFQDFFATNCPDGPIA